MSGWTVYRTLKRGALLAVLLLVQYQTSACDCLEERSVQDEIERLDAVVVGIIVGSEKVRVYDSFSEDQSMYREEVKFEMVVQKTYKGKKTTHTAYIYTGVGSGDCGYPFQVGRKYIVYAAAIDSSERYADETSTVGIPDFYTSTCTRSRSYSDEEAQAIEKALSGG